MKSNGRSKTLIAVVVALTWTTASAPFFTFGQTYTAPSTSAKACASFYDACIGLLKVDVGTSESVITSGASPTAFVDAFHDSASGDCGYGYSIGSLSQSSLFVYLQNVHGHEPWLHGSNNHHVTLAWNLYNSSACTGTSIGNGDDYVDFTVYDEYHPTNTAQCLGDGAMDCSGGFSDPTGGYCPLLDLLIPRPAQQYQNIDISYKITITTEVTRAGYSTVAHTDTGCIKTKWI